MLVQVGESTYKVHLYMRPEAGSGGRDVLFFVPVVDRTGYPLVSNSIPVKSESRPNIAFKLALPSCFNNTSD